MAPDVQSMQSGFCGDTERCAPSAVRRTTAQRNRLRKRARWISYGVRLASGAVAPPGLAYDSATPIHIDAESIYSTAGVTTGTMTPSSQTGAGGVLTSSSNTGTGSLHITACKRAGTSTPSSKTVAGSLRPTAGDDAGKSTISSSIGAGSQGIDTPTPTMGMRWTRPSTGIARSGRFNFYRIAQRTASSVPGVSEIAWPDIDNEDLEGLTQAIVESEAGFAEHIVNIPPEIWLEACRLIELREILHEGHG